MGSDIRKPTVLQVVLSLTPGGAERTVVELVRRSRDRIDHVVCCLDHAGDWAEQVQACGVPVVVLGRPPGFHPGTSIRLARLARAYGASVLHCHQYSPFVYGQLARLVAPSLRMIFTEQGRLSDAPPSLKRRVANAILGRLPLRAFAVSAELRQYMLAEGFPPDKVEVIPNAVEPRAAPDAASRSEARSRLGLADGAFAVGTAARFDPVKDLGTLVLAFSELTARLASPTLVLIGDGPERERLEELVLRTNLADRVVFTGMRQDVRSLLPGLDAFVNCSTSEGTSLTIMEAMAAALPVVATKVGGNPEVVVDSQTGILVPARAPSALASALLSLAAEPGRARLLGQAGRSRMEAHFSLDRVVDRYVALYIGAAGGASGRLCS